MSRKAVLNYIGDKKRRDHGGIITVASTADFESGKVSVGLSFCSPSDTFYRWKGRSIAEGRLKKYPIILNFKTKPKDAISKFLFGLVSDNREFCDHVEALPEKAAKHFPVRFPWFKHFDLPFGILQSIEGGGGLKEEVA
jgi:hypothetical protein